MRYPMNEGLGNYGSSGNDGPAAMRYTECRMTPLAMEMVRDIRENTVDFSPNYDGKTQEPDILPSRIPNLLMNGSGGIAVDRKSTRLNSSHVAISYAVFCLKKKNNHM